MSNIIDYTFFIGKINLPQVGNTDGCDSVEAFITTYEPEYLKLALGYDLWKAFSDGIAGSGVADQRWVDLLQGKDFVYSGKNYKWEGFENKPSPISQYIYYQIQQDVAIDTTLIGQSTAAAENATRVNPVSKMIQAWNDMVQLNVVLWNFLYANRAVYPEWNTSGYYDTWYWPDIIGYCHRNEIFNLKNSFDL